MTDELGTLCADALPDVYRRARMLLPPGEVDDVVQETFLSVVESWRRWRGEAAFGTWVAAILRYRAADYYRQAQRQPETVPLLESFHPLRDCSRLYDAQLVMSALPRSDREILMLRLWYQCSFDEAGQALGISTEAAKSRYRRAKHRFGESWLQ